VITAIGEAWHLAGHSAFVADDAILREVTQSTEHSPHATQLLFHEGHLPFLDLSPNHLLLFFEGSALTQNAESLAHFPLRNFLVR
jgi:hypothetical protein